MYKFVNEFPNELILSESEGPYISIYQPTHRHGPENQQDPIRFKNLVREVENSLKMKYPKRDIEAIMKPLLALADDKEFWNHTYDGIGILSVDGETIIYNLKRSVKELAIVSNSFHIKPLIRIFQSADRYHLLGLSGKQFALFEGNRYGFDPVELGDDIPKTIDDVLGDKRTEAYLSAGAYGGRGGQPMFHGHGSKKDEIDKDIDKFFRFVDRVVLDEFSREEKLPVILVALDEHHGIFKEISHNPYLMDKGIKKNYDSLDIKELRESAWKEIEPLYIEKTKELVDEFENARAQDLGSDDIVQVAKAAVEGRIQSILIESDKVVAGKINKENGQIKSKDLENPEVDDVLDDIAEIVMKSSGKVVMLPKERMPSTTGVAAIYRF